MTFSIWQVLDTEGNMLGGDKVQFYLFIKCINEIFQQGQYGGPHLVSSVFKVGSGL